MRLSRIYILLLGLALTSAAFADWGSLFDDLTEKGKSLLNQPAGRTTLDNRTLVAGLKEALEQGTRLAVKQVSQTNGYLNNPKIHIPMPSPLQKVSRLMRNLGLGQLADDFETSLNHAAEKAAPQAREIFVDTIKNMSFQDARNILQGPNDAATRYFEQQTHDKLSRLFKPVIQQSLNDVGATRHYTSLTQKVADLPVVGQKVDLNLSDYVTQQALKGLFVMIAEEEKKIRTNPAARTTELLKKVFTQ